ncbi:MAG: cytidylate kinase-like family protein [bacterium]
MLTGNFEKCLSYVSSQLAESKDKNGHVHLGTRPAVTFSRMTGCRMPLIGAGLVDYLNEHSRDHVIPWTFFDKNLVQKVLEDHNLPSHLEKCMPEDKTGVVEDLIGEIFGSDPSHWFLIQKTRKTIYQLGRLGNVLIVGRGANIITHDLPNMVHVRLIGSFERRVARMRESLKLSEREAQAWVKKTDLARQRYVMAHFGEDINNPFLYHLIINTDHFSDETIINIVGEAALQREKELRARKK